MIAHGSWSRDFLFRDELRDFIVLSYCQIRRIFLSFHGGKSTSWQRLQIGSIRVTVRENIARRPREHEVELGLAVAVHGVLSTTAFFHKALAAIGEA